MKLVHVCLLFAEQIERFTRSNQTSNSLHSDEGTTTTNNLGSSTAPAHRRRGSAAIGIPDRKESLTAIRQTKIDVQTAEIRRIVADESYIQMIERQVNTFDTEVNTNYSSIYRLSVFVSSRVLMHCFIMIIIIVGKFHRAVAR